MLTQIDFHGELRLLHEDEEADYGQRPVGPAKFLPRDQEERYIGPDRRRGERRRTGDRREMVRFQEVSDRRSAKDRRRVISGAKTWI